MTLTAARLYFDSMIQKVTKVVIGLLAAIGFLSATASVATASVDTATPASTESSHWG
jgi:hypothetical protein